MYLVHSSKSSQQHKLYYIPKHNSSPYSQRIQSFCLFIYLFIYLFGVLRRGQMYIPYIPSQIPLELYRTNSKKLKRRLSHLGQMRKF